MTAIRRSSSAPNVTAGLKWPPEIEPKTTIAANSASPKPNGTTARIGAPIRVAARIDIEPTNTRTKVPRSSARYLEAFIQPSTVPRVVIPLGRDLGQYRPSPRPQPSMSPDLSGRLLPLHGRPQLEPALNEHLHP